MMPAIRWASATPAASSPSRTICPPSSGGTPGTIAGAFGQGVLFSDFNGDSHSDIVFSNGNGQANYHRAYPVFDLNLMEWRSFAPDNLISIEAVEGTVGLKGGFTPAEKFAVST